jgi:hypothetical protein
MLFKEKLMIHRISVLVLFLAACAVLAAPAPKDNWERPIDPDHDCKFDMSGDTVTMELPGGDHELDLSANASTLRVSYAMWKAIS